MGAPSRSRGPRYLRTLRERRVTRRLLVDDDAIGDDEVIITGGEVHHHWAAYTLPALEGVLAVGLLWLLATSSAQVGWVFIVLFFGLVAHAALKAAETYLDVFVITSFRVFRVSGLGATKYASTPLSRILDITVEQTSLGLLLGYGHFTFESAAQEQGLRDIRYVSRPLERDRIIQQQQLRLLRRQRHRGESGT